MVRANGGPPARAAVLVAWVFLTGSGLTGRVIAQEAAVEAGSGSPGPAAGQAEPSEAERIAGLNRVLEADRGRRASLQGELATLEVEFEQASEEFGRLDTRLTEERTRLGAAPAEEKPRRQQAVAALDAEHAAARARFDLVIRRRSAARQQLDTLAEKIALEEEALERVTNPEAVAKAEAAPAGDDPATAATPDEHAATSVPGLPSVPGLTVSPAAEAVSSGTKPTAAGRTELASEPADDRVIEARKELAARRDELRAARRDLELLDRGLDVFERDFAASRELFEAARQQAQAAEAAVRAADERLAALGSDPPPAEADRLRRELDEADRRLAAERRRVAGLAAQVDQAGPQLERLRARRPAAAERVEGAQEAVASAEERLRFLESPLAPHRLWRWLRDAGPRVAVVVIGMIVAWWLARSVGRRVVGELVRRSRRGTEAEREGRAETLRRVFQNAAGLAIAGAGSLAVLDQAGIDVTVLLGGAAVIGAAVAFGAQNLIKDYFTGFMILVENQYSVGNVVRLGGLSGSVEDISLRATVLRDEEGAVHFVPHGQITTVTNLTHGWSRAVFAVPVGYGEDVDRVMAVLLDLAKELRDDPEFGPKTLGEPEMQGVEALGDSAVVIKFLVKTRPLQQWSVKRELLRRIKKRFDRLGIEIPFPHQTVLYRELGGDGERRSPGPDAESRVDAARPEGNGKG